MLDLQDGCHDVEMYVDILVDGQYERHVTGAIESLLKPGMTFVDCGANNGYFSILAFQIMGHSGNIIALEPAPKAFSRLVRNKRLNGANNIRTVNSAAGNRDGVVELNLSEKEDGLNSISKLDGQTGSINVNLCKLDTILEGLSVDIMKMDVEGEEARVLEGMREVLTGSFNPIVILEHNFFVLKKVGSERLFEAIKSSGLVAHELTPGGCTLECVLSAKDLTSLSTTLVCHRHL